MKYNLNITTSNLQRLDTFYVFDQIGLVYSVTSTPVETFDEVQTTTTERFNILFNFVTRKQ